MTKKVAIITGASSGFGVHYAKELDNGYDLDEIWLVARRLDRLEKLSSEFQNTKGIAIKADLTKKEEIEKIADKLYNEKPDIKLLINNAGYGRLKEFEKEELNYLNDMVDLNVRAVVHLTHRALPFMKRGAKIVNVASSAGFTPLPYFSAYSASKAFVLYLSYGLKTELKEKGIDTIAVCPGPAATEFFDNNGELKTKGIKIAPAEKVVKKSLRDMKKGRFASVYGIDINFFRLFSWIMPKTIMSKLAGKFKFMEQ